MNTKHQNIKFTSECEKNDCFSFLDVKNYTQRKPISYISFSSSFAFHMKNFLEK